MKKPGPQIFKVGFQELDEKHLPEFLSKYRDGKYKAIVEKLVDWANSKPKKKFMICSLGIDYSKYTYGQLQIFTNRHFKKLNLPYKASCNRKKHVMVVYKVKKKEKKGE